MSTILLIQKIQKKRKKTIKWLGQWSCGRGCSSSWASPWFPSLRLYFTCPFPQSATFHMLNSSFCLSLGSEQFKWSPDIVALAGLPAGTNVKLCASGQSQGVFLNSLCQQQSRSLRGAVCWSLSLESREQQSSVPAPNNQPPTYLLLPGGEGQPSGQRKPGERQLAQHHPPSCMPAFAACSEGSLPPLPPTPNTLSVARQEESLKWDSRNIFCFWGVNTFL